MYCHYMILMMKTCMLLVVNITISVISHLKLLGSSFRHASIVREEDC